MDNLLDLKFNFMHNLIEIQQAKKIGSKIALFLTGVGIITAYLIMSLIIMSFFWILKVDFIFHLIVGAFAMLITAKYLGRYVGWLIIIRRRCSVLIGVVSGLLILIGGTFCGSLIGFFQEGIGSSDLYEAMFNYLIKPIYWVSLFGFIPVIISGIIYGLKLKQKRKLLD
jgi:hypothetical protein